MSKEIKEKLYVNGYEKKDGRVSFSVEIEKCNILTHPDGKC